MPEQPRRRGRPPKAKPAAPATVQVLDRALDLLDRIARSGAAGLTLTEIAAQTGQAASTVHRLLASLGARGMVDTDPATQVWYIGPETYRMGAAFLRRGGLAERAAPILRRLMQATSETANLGIRDGDAVLIVAQTETPRPIRALFPPGTRLPLATSGLGRAIMALDTDADDMELVATRARGFALDREEVEPGMRCVAAVVTDAQGSPIAAISISGPTHRVGPEHLKTLGAAVTEAARQLSQAMGAAMPD
ncbi:MAG: IclR family transcriptional regulator [Paracoccus sp. (in: a-proteobacteria)]|uniref:IclR family transcriptional regulator n=1 Tax=Paracoccus sp. TaxID=267 RepID=UPI0026DF1FFD|nr:IclR family transcriptional regulator [Paracoccus sp. (in: a-proteobacteria)]MDO5611730.1 IclR family transcriptional regulator [Paracoccus sp. (in: a-proteobacteria)]